MCDSITNNLQYLSEKKVEIQESAMTIILYINTFFQNHHYDLWTKSYRTRKYADITVVLTELESNTDLKSFFTEIFSYFDEDSEHGFTETKPSLDAEGEICDPDHLQNMLSNFTILLSNCRAFYSDATKYYIDLSKECQEQFKDILASFEQFLYDLKKIFSISERSNFPDNLDLHILNSLLPSKIKFQKFASSTSECYQYTCFLLAFIINEHVQFKIQNRKTNIQMKKEVCFT